MWCVACSMLSTYIFFICIFIFVWLLVTEFSCSAKRLMNVTEQTSVLWAVSSMDCGRAAGYKD
jgi:hypothetical protein